MICPATFFLKAYFNFIIGFTFYFILSCQFFIAAGELSTYGICTKQWTEFTPSLILVTIESGTVTALLFIKRLKPSLLRISCVVLPVESFEIRSSRNISPLRLLLYLLFLKINSISAFSKFFPPEASILFSIIFSPSDFFRKCHKTAIILQPTSLLGLYFCDTSFSFQVLPF